MASSLSLFPSFPKPSKPPSISSPHRRRWISAVRSSLSAQPLVAGPDDLVSSILSKVKGTDRGVLLSKDGHREVSDVAQKLQKYCISEPVKCPLIFGEWDVLYCSVPTSPGGGYRSSFGRLFLNAKEMVQVVEAPDIVLNKVSFSVLGLLDGEVSLKGCIWDGGQPPARQKNGFSLVWESAVRIGNVPKTEKSPFLRPHVSERVRHSRRGSESPL